jgi:hypothetical protein
MQLEVGLNTRHFEGADRDVAFRTGESAPQSAGFEGGTAVSSSIRFTGRTRWNTFLGVEAEAGALVGYSMSNLAGAYGIAGAHQDFSRLRLGVEVVGGRRWVRYGGGYDSDPSTWIAEPRVRADLWLGSQATIGAAAGATLSDHHVWMAGVYVGVCSSAFGRWR